MTTRCVARDFEEWGQVSLEAHDLMERALGAIRQSTAVVVEFSEKGVGLGIEAGYALALDIRPHRRRNRTGSTTPMSADPGSVHNCRVWERGLRVSAASANSHGRVITAECGSWVMLTGTCPQEPLSVRNAVVVRSSCKNRRGGRSSSTGFGSGCASLPC